MKPLNAQTVDKPVLPVKILQFGEGNFLRAFADWMIQKANDAKIMNHGIAIVQPIESGNVQKLSDQDCLYHLVLEGIRDKKPVREISLVKSIVKAVNPYQDYNDYEELFLSPDLEIIISNTTEAGIAYLPEDDIKATPPKSFPAKITALLHKRWEKFGNEPDKELFIICCELIEDNGSTLKQYVLKHALANKLSSEFVEWINTKCHFYNTIVDRIVTGFPHEDAGKILEETGFDDKMIVKAEYFHMWVISGNGKILKKFPLNDVGLNVIFTDDIRHSRNKKVRILNGAHTAIVSVAIHLNCETVLDAFGNPLVERFIRAMIYGEILQTIDENADELIGFTEKILERFYNPYLKHYLSDISLNSLSKWETRLMPSLFDNNSSSKPSPLITFSFAALLVLYSGQSEAKNFIPKDDPEAIKYIQSTFDPQDYGKWIEKVCKNLIIRKEDLSAIENFAEKAAEYVEIILEKGMEKALETVLKV